MNLKRGYLLIALAGCLWGTIGMFGKLLFAFGLTPRQTVFCRLFIGFCALLIYILIKDRSLLKIDGKGLKYTALIGLISQSLFNLFYFSTIQVTTIATAVILLYTAPIFLIVMGRIFYKEPFTKVKIIALLLCITGCFLTVTGGQLEALKLNLSGILFGLGAGFTYAMITILGKAIVNQYHPITVILYGYGFGWLFLIPISQPWSLLSVHFSSVMVLDILGLGLIPGIFAYVCYITGLTHGVEASKAGIISSLEIVVSVLISAMFFAEKIQGLKLLGVVTVLVAIVIIQLDLTKLWKK